MNKKIHNVIINEREDKEFLESLYTKAMATILEKRLSKEEIETLISSKE